MAQGDVLGFIKNRPRNRIHNGGFDSWQLTPTNTITNSSAFSADRFKDVAIGSTVVAGIARQTDAPNSKSVYSNRLTINTSDGMGNASDVVSMFQNIEGYDIADLFGKKISFGFWVKSNVTGIYSATLSTTAGAGNSYVQEFEILAADTWECKKFENILLDNAFMNGDKTNGVGLVLHILLDAGSSRKVSTLNSWIASSSSAICSDNQVAFAGSSSNYFQITQVMFNEGPVVASFERAGVNITNELQLCQRYYEELCWAGSGYSYTSTGTAILNHARFVVEKRDAPVFTELNGNGDSNINIQAVNISNPTYKPTLDAQINVTAASINSFWRLNNYYIACDAEL